MKYCGCDYSGRSLAGRADELPTACCSLGESCKCNYGRGYLSCDGIVGGAIVGML